MECVYSSATGEELRSELTTLGSRGDVAGLVLLATPSVDVTNGGFETTLQSVPVPVCGGVFPQVIADGERHDSGLLAIGLPNEPTITVVSELSEPDTDLDASLPAGGSEAAFVFVDAYAGPDGVESLIDALFRTYSVGLSVVGGGAGRLDDDGPCLFTADGVIEDAAVMAVVDRPIGIGVRHGWEELAGPFRVTDADGGTIRELDGEPAFDVYKDAIETNAEATLQRDSFFETATAHPFGISRLDGEPIVRDPFAVDGAAISCFGPVPEGEFVTVLSGEPDTLIGAAEQAADTALGDETVAEDAETLCVFDCISRQLYLEDSFDREVSAIDTDALPMVGALTIGEIANDGTGHLDYYNKTAVVAAVSTDA
ncbi:FIST signal transduction protein [Halonotius roseus]|uniref:Histidine kinase n=1 Tax=Halonotius roseus TaxID=2511997 RepID=A0A544QRZ9_9EURY|nr:FIST C-terminal domain-containing protein [Halonotius roseus]TQQ82189.1 histidine kinase [Halonotius roseus]